MPPLPQQAVIEAANVAWAVTNQPLVYEGVEKKADQALDAWLANVAYWRCYPQAPKKLAVNPNPEEQIYIDTWLRLHAAVVVELAKVAPPLAWTEGKPRWPLRTVPSKIKPGNRFSVQRPWAADKPTRHHCGNDISAKYGDPVVATEAGVIGAVDVGWEAPTKAVLVHLDSGYTVLCGGIQLGSSPKVGTRVAAGDIIGRVERYPKGSTMCHFQLYRGKLTRAQVAKQQSWYLGSPQPPDLLDPKDYLDACRVHTPLSQDNAAAAFYGLTPDEPAANDIENVEQAEGVEPPDPGEVIKVPAPPSAAPSNTGLWIGVGLGVLVLGGAAYIATRDRAA